MQAIRPRVVLAAPLKIGLSVQLHHYFASKSLLDILLGFVYPIMKYRTLRHELQFAKE